MSSWRRSCTSHLRIVLSALIILDSSFAGAAAVCSPTLPICAEPTQTLIGRHPDAVVDADGSVLPETGSTSPPHHPDKARALELFEQAVNLAAEGRYAEACPKFEASEALDVGVGTLLHLGDCYENLGRFASAWTAFRTAETLARVHGMASRLEIAMARAAALEPKLPRLVLVVPPESRLAELRISVGEHRVAQQGWGAPIPVDPGPQVIHVEAPGHAPARVELEVSAEGAEHHRVLVPRLDPLPQPGPATLEDPASVDTGAGYRLAGLVTGAGGIIALGTAGIFAALAAETNEQSLRHCPSSSRLCSAEGVSLREQAGTYADVATVTVAVGGALLVTGIALYAAAPKPNQKPATLNVSPMLGTSSTGLRVGGSF
jgi:hypothetical protein